MSDACRDARLGIILTFIVGVIDIAMYIIVDDLCRRGAIDIIGWWATIIFFIATMLAMTIATTRLALECIRSRVRFYGSKHD